MVTPLGGGGRRGVLRELGELGVEAVAVCLLWSIANPAHELAIGALIEERAAGHPVHALHRLNPIIREYRRTSSAAIDASLKPLMQAHLSDMEDASCATRASPASCSSRRRSAASCRCERHGGTADLHGQLGPGAGARRRPRRTPLPSRRGHIVVCDTGGTSFDVGLVRDGEVVFTRETWLGGRSPATSPASRRSTCASIGAGGGSIAWIDSGGLLRVGPQSAGAEPGPACYGRGGSGRPSPTQRSCSATSTRPTSSAASSRSTLRRRTRRSRRSSPAARFQRPAGCLAILDGRQRAHGRRRARDHDQPGHRPARVHRGRRRRRRWDDDVEIAGELGCDKVLRAADRRRSRRPAAILGDIVAEFAVSRRPTRTNSTTSSSMQGSRIWIARSTSSSRTWTCPPTRVCRD